MKKKQPTPTPGKFPKPRSAEALARYLDKKVKEQRQKKEGKK